MKIREIELTDAEKLATLIMKVDQESSYMLWEPGERIIQKMSQLKMIQDIKASDNSTILVVEEKDNLVGYLFAIGGKANRNRHSVYLVIGISKEHRGKGIGTALFKALDQWATGNKVHRLELTVVSKNDGAVALYTKMGFELEGTKRDSLQIDGEFLDEYYMAKLLDPE